MALEQQGLMGINLDLDLGANADHDQSQEDGANNDTGDVVSDIQVLKAALAGQTDASDSDNGSNVAIQGNLSESVDASSASQESSEARNEESSQLKVESE